MATRQGNKYYMQVLLDPGKYQLLESAAKERGVKITALARDAIYHWLSENTNPDIFDAANKLDDAYWKQSVRNRVNARIENRRLSLEKDEES